MRDAYPLREGRCAVPWPGKDVYHSPGGMQIEVFDRTAPLRTDTALAVWEFDAIPRPIFLDVDFWSVDLYSVRLVTADGARLAHKFASNLEGAVPDRLGIRARCLPMWAPIVLSAEIEVSAAERAALRRRLDNVQIPTIDWFFVELTSRCNFRCGWCPLSRMRRESGAMPLDRAKVVLDQIAAYQKSHPIYSLYTEIRNPVFLHIMGEPLLYPHLFEVLEYGRAHGVEFCLITNASLLRQDRISRLLDADLSSIVFSLNAPDAASFQLAKSPVKYERVLAQVQAFVAERYRRGAARPRIELQLLNTRGVELDGCALVQERSQVEQQLAFWSRFVRNLERTAGANSSRDERQEVARWPSVLEHEDNDLGVYFELGRNISLVFKRACNFANTLVPVGSSVRETRTGQCRFRCPYRMFAIYWDGSSTFCTLDFDNEVNLGNVFERGIEEIWAGERMQRIRRLMDRGILLERICRACMGSVEHPRSNLSTWRESNDYERSAANQPTDVVAGGARFV